MRFTAPPYHRNKKILDQAEKNTDPYREICGDSKIINRYCMVCKLQTWGDC